MKHANQIGWTRTSQALFSNLFRHLKRAPKLKYAMLASLAVVMCSTANSQAVALIEISGTVINQEKNEPLQDVSVQIKGSVTGTITDNTGSFILRTKQKLPFTLVFSSVGFKAKELEVKSLGSKLQVAM